MISRFVNLFRKNDPDEQRAFQIRVLALLKDRYPTRKFSLTHDPLTLMESDGTISGLTNIRANFLLSDQTEDVLVEIVAAQFDAIFDDTEELYQELSWDTAKSLLMPQLMPVEFLEKMPLVHFPFGDNIAIGFVVDAEKAYSYVRTDQLEEWDLSESELRTTAFANLKEQSQGIEMVAVPGDNGLFVVNTMDGFDAVRILDRALQETIADHIGSPFYAGVPNRDFLICWSQKGDAEFQTQMRSQISNDFDERTYPLSRNVFEVSDDGTVEIAIFGADDPRVLTAELN